MWCPPCPVLGGGRGRWHLSSPGGTAGTPDAPRDVGACRGGHRHRVTRQSLDKATPTQPNPTKEQPSPPSAGRVPRGRAGRGRCHRAVLSESSSSSGGAFTDSLCAASGGSRRRAASTPRWMDGISKWTRPAAGTDGRCEGLPGGHGWVLAHGVLRRAGSAWCHRRGGTRGPQPGQLPVPTPGGTLGSLSRRHEHTQGSGGKSWALLLQLPARGPCHRRQHPGEQCQSAGTAGRSAGGHQVWVLCWGAPRLASDPPQRLGY